MMDHGIHLLCAGDLHLGRYPSRIRSEFRSERLSPTFIWQKMVEKAIGEKVHALFITGDVVDEKNRYYEAFGPFEAGVKKLVEKGIYVITVAGNHDYDTLPRLAQSIDSPYFSCLGIGGRWEKKTIYNGERPILNVMGWSYPTRLVKKNPLEDLQLPEEELPVVGLLHSELNLSQSSYAPVSTAQLQGMGVVGWILGHIHKPELIKNTPPFILYPGSPQPLDPGETDVHGVWDLKINSHQDVQIEKSPLATLEYVHLTLDLSGLKQLEELPAYISARVSQKLQSGEACPDRELIICRVTLTNRTELHHSIDEQLDGLTEDLRLSIEGTTVIIDKLVNETRPSVDLETFAQGKSPPAILAGYLLDMVNNRRDSLPEELIKRVEAALHTVYNSNAYYLLRAQNRISPPGREEALAILKKEAWLLLDTLLAQKEGEP